MKNLTIAIATEQEMEAAGLGLISGATPSWVKQYSYRTQVSKSFECSFRTLGGSVSSDALSGNIHVTQQQFGISFDATGEFAIDGKYVVHSFFAKVNEEIAEIHVRAKF